MLIIIMQIGRRQWPTSSLGTLNLLQELCLLAICIAEERERKKATQFELLEKKILLSTQQETGSLSKSTTECCVKIV